MRCLPPVLSPLPVSAALGDAPSALAALGPAVLAESAAAEALEAAPVIAETPERTVSRRALAALAIPTRGAEPVAPEVGELAAVVVVSGLITTDLMLSNACEVASEACGPGSALLPVTG